MAIARIVSGGQTGVDIAALDAAIECGLPHGGWCPLGRKQERGKRIPLKYDLREIASADYRVRTKANVVDSDATLILCPGQPTGGTLSTVELAVSNKRPWLQVDTAELDDRQAVQRIKAWFDGEMQMTPPPENCVLNVAGPRESGAPGIGEAVKRLMVALIHEVNGSE